MSAEIKMASVTTPPIVIKVAGKCYSLQQEAVYGKPDTQLSSIQWSGTTCAACQADGEVPPACPCSDWTIIPCGVTGEEIDRYLVVDAEGLYFLTGSPTYGSWDGSIWNGTLTRSHEYTTLCEMHSWLTEPGSLGNVIRSNITGTAYQLSSSTGAVTCKLVPNTYWMLTITSGTANAVFLKRDGNGMSGTYTIGEHGVSYEGVTNNASLPGTIEVEDYSG